MMKFILKSDQLEIVLSVYDKPDDFSFEILIFHFLIEIFLAPFPMVYIFCSLFVCESLFLLLCRLKQLK